MVEICKNLEQLDEFCRQICIKLECCPNLISPHFVGDHCPETCSQLTKTKYSKFTGSFFKTANYVLPFRIRITTQLYIPQDIGQKLIYSKTASACMCTYYLLYAYIYILSCIKKQMSGHLGSHKHWVIQKTLI